jgi:hypothetical protein
MRVRGALLVLLPPLAIFTGTYLIQYDGQDSRDTSAPAALLPAESPAGRESGRPYQPTPVALNRGPEVRDGFRGDIHPLLFGRTRLEVMARWTPVGEVDKMVNPTLDAWFANLRPAQELQRYTEDDFSAFLPQVIGAVGQLWALDADKIVKILRQFHPRPSLRQVPSGRRAGPDGAFAILRAVSPSYLDIVFRIHAEFSLEPEHRPTDRPPVRVWYTPAYFTGRVLVNRRTGTVDHFRLELANDKAINVHLTVDFSGMGKNQPHAIVRVEHMELTGGDGGLVENIPWTTALSRAEADRRLAKVFFKFLDIDWVPFDQVAARARSRGRPIFAVVSWGAIDDQSC